jgi:hypothetical protein
MERKNSWKSLAGMTCAPAAPRGGFKRCCMGTVLYDGSNRNYCFPQVVRSSNTSPPRRAKFVAQGAACGALPHFATRLLLTFAFYSLFYSP